MPRLRTPPGEVLRAEFMVPLGPSANRLAAEIDVPPKRLGEIVRERRGVTADTALRLSVRFGTTPQFRLNLHTAHDLSHAEAETDLSKVRQHEPA